MRLLESNFASLARTIGSLFIPVLQTVLPYINGLVIALQRLFSWIAGLFGINLSDYVGSMGGAAVDMGLLADEAEDVASGMGDAAGAAEKMRKSLRSYDELNVVPEKTDTSAGAGGGAGGVGDMSALNAALDDILEEYQKAWNDAFAQMENRANEIADNIVNAFKNGDYKAIGSYISNGIEDALDRINWNSVYSGMSKFGSGLAEFLNGLITPDLFGTVGRTIGNAINSALIFLNSFGTTFDWTNFGESIAAGINNFFATTDFKLAANTFNTWAIGILDALISALENTDWSLIGEKIGTFLADIDFATILSKIGELIWEAIQAAIELWGSMFNAAPIETIIITAFAALSFTGLGKTLLSTMFSAISAKFAIPSLTGLATTHIVIPLGTSIGTALSGLASAIAPFLAPIAAALAALAVVGIGIHEALSPAIEEIDILSDEVDACGRQLSDTTITKLTPFLTSLKELDTAFAEIEFTGKIISDETVSDTQTKLNTIVNTIISELDADKNEALANLNPLKNFMNSEDYAVIGQEIVSFYNETTQAITDGETRINEIMASASAEKRTLTEEEQIEIATIQEKMRDTGIQCMTESEEEQFLIMTRLKENAEALSAEQASSIIKKSIETRDETIANAKDQYDQILIQAENLKNSGAINEEQYQTMIDSAAKAREETIKEAETQYDTILTTTQDKLGETAKYIDGETGNIKSNWTVFWGEMGEEFSTAGKEITEDIEEAWEDIKEQASGAWDTIKTTVTNKVEELKNDVITWVGNIKQNWDTTWDNMKTSIGGTVSSIAKSIEDGIGEAVDYITGLPSKALGWGKDIVNSLAEGIRSIKLPKFDIDFTTKTTHILGKEIEYPWIDISWYAQGGVFNTPSVIGVGENGAEAVMPLENNTEWIDILAGKIAISMAEMSASETEPQQNVNVVIEGEMKNFIRAIVKESRNYYKQTGMSLF